MIISTMELFFSLLPMIILVIVMIIILILTFKLMTWENDTYCDTYANCDTYAIFDWKRLTKSIEIRSYNLSQDYFYIANLQVGSYDCYMFYLDKWEEGLLLQYINADDTIIIQNDDIKPNFAAYLSESDFTYPSWVLTIPTRAEIIRV
jgi:hypothetical protein